MNFFKVILEDISPHKFVLNNEAIIETFLHSNGRSIIFLLYPIDENKVILFHKFFNSMGIGMGIAIVTQELKLAQDEGNRK